MASMYRFPGENKTCTQNKKHQGGIREREGDKHGVERKIK